MILNINLHLIVSKYNNKHTQENFKGRTPYNPDSEGETSTPKSNNSGNNVDFSSAALSNSKKKD